jgi:O-antigen ligase
VAGNHSAWLERADGQPAGPDMRTRVAPTAARDVRHGRRGAEGGSGTHWQACLAIRQVVNRAPGRPGVTMQSHGTWTTRTLVFLPILAALGPYASLQPSSGSPFYFYRVLCVLILIPSVAVLIASHKWAPLAPKAHVAVAFAWALWAPAALIWNPEGASGGRQVLSISFALIGGLYAVSLSGGSTAGIKALRTGWIWAFLATGSVAAWEVLSGRHLESNVILQLSGAHYVTSTFYNQNNYAGFLLACLPSLIHATMDARSAVSRTFHKATLGAWVCLAVATQSRTAVFGAVLAVPVVAYWIVRTARLKGHKLLGPSLRGGAAAIIALATLARSAPGQRILQDFNSPFQNSASTLRSDEGRMTLTRLGWKFFLDSGMLGRGPRTFDQSVLSHIEANSLHGTTSAHNSLIELAAQYGIVPTAPLLALIAIVIYGAVVTTRQEASNPLVLNLRMSILLGMVAFLASSIVASSTLGLPWWWILLGNLTAQSWLLHRIRQHPVGSNVPCALAYSHREDVPSEFRPR